MSDNPVRVRIVGDHPWSGYTGELLAIQTFKFCLPKMGRVRLDRGQDCPEDHECFAEPKNLKQIK